MRDSAAFRHIYLHIFIIHIRHLKYIVPKTAYFILMFTKYVFSDIFNFYLTPMKLNVIIKT